MDDLEHSEISLEQPTGERWDPLGAPNDQESEPQASKSENVCCKNTHW